MELRLIFRIPPAAFQASRRTRLLSTFLGLFGLAGCAGGLGGARGSLPVSDSLFVPMTFIEHVGPGPFQSYLAMNIHYPPVDDIRRDLETRSGLTLQTRGEAHVTVITPVEYDKVLGAKLPIARINEIAREADIQRMTFDPLCIGQGRKTLDGKEESTFFIVVNSPDLLALRRRIHEAFVLAGGDAKAFDPAAFYPHITVGFTKRDLHAEDGVTKNREACLQSMVKADR